MRQDGLPHGAGKGDDLHTPGSGRAENGCGRVDRRTGRVDVVDEQDARRYGPAAGAERATDVTSTLVEVQVRLSPGRSGAREERLRIDLPEPAERTCETLRRMVASRKLPVAVGGNPGDDSRRGRFDALHDDIRSELCDVAETSLLPGAHERARGTVVDDRGACRQES